MSVPKPTPSENTQRLRIADARERLDAALKTADLLPNSEFVTELCRDVIAILGGSKDAKAGADPRRARLIEKAQKWHNIHGAPPRSKDWDRVLGTEWPSYQTCIKVFGSWDEFILECGWKPRGRGRPTMQ